MTYVYFYGTNQQAFNNICSRIMRGIFQRRLSILKAYLGRPDG